LVQLTFAFKSPRGGTDVDVIPTRTPGWGLTLIGALLQLLQILGQISADIDQLAKEEGLDIRIARARKTMVHKADTVLNPHHQPPSLAGNTSTPSVDQEQDPHDKSVDISMTEFLEDPLAGGGSTGKEGNTPRQTHETTFTETNVELIQILSKISDQLAKEEGLDTRIVQATPRQTHETTFTETSVPQPSISSTSEVSEGSTRQKKKHKKVATSKLFSIVIFDEFLKELAAISQEQSIVSPLSYMPFDNR